MDVGAYDDELLAAIYDDDNPDGADHDYFRSVADEISAASITDLGCGTGTLLLLYKLFISLFYNTHLMRRGFHFLLIRLN